MFDPYSPPQGPLSDPDGEGDGQTGAARVFALSGRIGRVRFLAYGVASILLLHLSALAVGAMLARMVERLEVMGALLGGLTTLTSAAVAIVLGRRRLEDLDQSHWLAALLLLPLVNLFAALWLLIAPGVTGPNSHGPAPAPNTRAVVVLAWSLLAIAILGAVTVVILLKRFL